MLFIEKKSLNAILGISAILKYIFYLGSLDNILRFDGSKNSEYLPNYRRICKSQGGLISCFLTEIISCEERQIWTYVCILIYPTQH
jgi:hypothetical protein